MSVGWIIALSVIGVIIFGICFILFCAIKQSSKAERQMREMLAKEVREVLDVDKLNEEDINNEGN